MEERGENEQITYERKHDKDCVDKTKRKQDKTDNK